MIVKIILLALEFPIITLSLPAVDETQYFIPLSLNSTLQLTSGISGDLQKLFEYFNGIAIVAFFKILFAPSASVFSNNLALLLKDLKSSVFAISPLKLVASFFE